MDNFDEKLEELFANFRRQLPTRLSTCLDAWDSYTRDDDLDALHQLRFQTHKLAGAASIYGFDDIGDSARTIELLVDKYYAGDVDSRQKFHEQLQPHILLLQQLIHAVDKANH